MKGIKSTNPIAVGDVVDYDIENTTDETTGSLQQFTTERIILLENR